MREFKVHLMWILANLVLVIRIRLFFIGHSALLLAFTHAAYIFVRFCLQLIISHRHHVRGRRRRDPEPAAGQVRAGPGHREPQRGHLLWKCQPN